VRIVFYVSPHGYGHAARSAAIAEALRALDASVEIEFVTAVPRWFFEDSLSFRFDHTDKVTDIGLVQSNAIEEDIEATCEALELFWPPDESWLEDEVRRLRSVSTDRIVADISPLGLAVAERGRFSSVLVENFTWDWIYEHQTGATERLLQFSDQYRALYATVPDLVIQATPFCVARSGSLAAAPISRRMRMSRAEIRERLSIAEDRPSILLTMGGLSWDYDFLDRLLERPEVFIVPGGAEETTVRRNLRLLPHRSEYFHPDLVGATDALVGKVGYSTLAEAYAARTRFAFLDRPGFAESRILPLWLQEQLPAIEITREEFENATWLDRIDRLLAEPRPRYKVRDGALEAARAILA